MKKKISITIGDHTIRDIASIIDNLFIRNRSQAIEYLVSSSLSEKKTRLYKFILLKV
jgi:metal-responsive CopG/Arc/MetJ family transcriptional regulator